MIHLFKQKARRLIRTRFVQRIRWFKCNFLWTMNFHIAFPDKPVYLKCCRANNVQTETETSLLSFSNFFSKKQDIMLFLKTTEETNIESQYLKSAMESQKLLREITPMSSFHVALMYGYCKTNEIPQHAQVTDFAYKIYRGICVYTKNVSDSKNSDLIKLAYEHNFKTHFHVYKIEKNTCIIQEKDSLSMEIVSDQQYTIHDNWKTPGNHGGEVHQNQSMLFTYPLFCPVFHGYQAARELLYKCSYMPEVVALLDIADKGIPENFTVEELQNQIKHPFVVVEGLDATGKTTLTETLEKKLNATRYYTPPPEVYQLRQFFDALPEIIRRAYYCIGNYIVAVQIARECQNKSVIMDRFWHSTTAYGIANETSTSDLPPRQHWAYHWPSDLIKPTLVLFLSVSEEVRKQRIMGRGGEKTFEEKHLDKDILFRQRLCEAYRRMENPCCIEIDASGSKESVAQAAIDQLDKHGIKL